MSTATTRPTPLSLARPTAPLPQPAAAALSRLESAFPAVTAEQHRVERAATALHAGESAVINGTPVTAVSLAVAEAVTRYEVASARTAQLSHLMDERTLTVAEFDVLEHAQDVMAGAKASLAEAGMLRLIGGA